MFKSMLVSVAIAGATAVGGYAYGAAAQVVPAAPAVSAPASSLPAVAAVQPVAACGTTATTAATTAATPQTPAAGLVNLNAATAAELDALPGIGKATVARIIAARPIASVDTVGTLPGVSGPNFAKFKALVTV